MSEEIEMQDKQTKKTVNRKKLYYSIAALVVVAVLLVGFSFAWFFNKTDMATLMPIKEPSNITILGPEWLRTDIVGSELYSCRQKWQYRDGAESNLCAECSR